jgi:hypothetical protein
MGKIAHPPKDICYPEPKAVGLGSSTAKIIGRAMVLEKFPEWGDYMRILDLMKWEHTGHKEIRFCQFYRKAGGTENDWIFGQGAGHMKVQTFYKLIRKAKTKPDYGTFEGIFNKLCKSPHF